MLYAYIKKPSARPGWRLPKSFFPGLSVSLLFLGVFLIGQVAVPIVSSYLRLLPQYSSETVSPLASYEVLANAPVSDPYRPSTWFVAGTPNPISVGSLHTYTVSIPKLKIDNATVEIGGDDLKKSLIAWPTSALPGSYGVNIIFGHSELPSLANPKDYSGIFTFLMDLSAGDEILVDSDNVRYKYVVFDKKVVDPTDLSVLEQRFDRAYLTLITCVPPGTLWKRGVIRARLSSL